MKHKGGKGKKAPYATVVMRIPIPVKRDVEILIENFFKGVTSIEDKDVISLESESVTGVEDKGVTGIEEENYRRNLSHEELDLYAITTLSLPAQIVNVLCQQKINTVYHLISYTEANLLSIKNIGKKSVDQIKTALLQEFGVTLTTSAHQLNS